MNANSMTESGKRLVLQAAVGLRGLTEVHFRGLAEQCQYSDVP